MDIKTFSKSLLYRLQNDPVIMNQANLYLDFVQKGLSLDDYFNLQNKIDNLSLKDSIEIHWDQLEAQNLKEYNHEKAHFDVLKKYKVRSKLYRSSYKREPFVIYVDFNEVSKKKGYDKEMVIDILKESLLAPYRIAGDTIFSCYIDILCFEILDKNITSFKLGVFEESFSKYCT